MLKSADVPLSQSALLVIDAQDSFKLRSDRWNRRSNLDFEQNVDALIRAFRAAQRPVIFFLDNDGDEGFTPGHPAYKLMDFIATKPGEPVVEKTSRNCFTSTDLASMLLARGIRRVAITGICMEQCCETTARVASDLGYAVDFVVNGTMTFPIPNPEMPGQELDVAAIEERTTYALRNRFARIVRTASLVNELTSVS